MEKYHLNTSRLDQEAMITIMSVAFLYPGHKLNTNAKVKMVDWRSQVCIKCKLQLTHTHINQSETHQCNSQNPQIFLFSDDRSRFDQKLVTLLKSIRSEEETKNDTQLRFWVGASDLGERGTFVWYTSDNKNVSDNNWAFNGRADKDTHVQYDDYAADKDQRCLQIDTNGKWNAFSCEFESRFVCQFSPASNRYTFINLIHVNRQKNPQSRSIIQNDITWHFLGRSIAIRWALSLLVKGQSVNVTLKPLVQRQHTRMFAADGLFANVDNGLQVVGSLNMGSGPGK